MTKKKVVRERCINRNREIMRLIERVRVRESEKKRLRKVESKGEGLRELERERIRGETEDKVIERHIEVERRETYYILREVERIEREIDLERERERADARK